MNDEDAIKCVLLALVWMLVVSAIGILLTR